MNNTQMPTAQRPTYVAPKVQTLGKWETVTLIQSVPIGPGSIFDPARQGGNAR